MNRTVLCVAIGLVSSAFLVIAACSSDSATPAAVVDAGTDASEPVDAYVAPVVDAAPDAPPTAIDIELTGCLRDPGAPKITVDPNDVHDPAGSPAQFTMAKALAGFPAGSGKLTVLISTEKGFIRCTLDEAAAPISSANFVGLARGTRPYLDDNAKWVVGHFYDGLTWHRVIPDFVVQGGDPEGTGGGGPGYDLVDENHLEEEAGTLAMAAGTKPSGSQFYVVVGHGPPADYNVFGKCDLDAAVAISNVPTDDAGNKPFTPVHMQHVDIARCP